MRKIIILIVFLSVSFAYSQGNPPRFKNGIRLPDATEQNGLTRIPIMADDGTINGYIFKASITGSTDASDLDTGVLDNARVQESNVTQHQSALTITESQISDLSHTVDTQLNLSDIEGFGFVTGAHTIDTQLNEAQVDAFVANNGYLTSEVDGSVSNEIQSLSILGQDISISGGNTITIPESSTGPTPVTSLTQMTDNLTLYDLTQDDGSAARGRYYRSNNGTIIQEETY